MPDIITGAGITTYRCDICGTECLGTLRCHRAITDDDTGEVLAGTENIYCPDHECTAPLEPGLHEHP